jgi:hypothetical protein
MSTENNSTPDSSNEDRWYAHLGFEHRERGLHVPISFPLPKSISELITNTRKRLKFLGIAALVTVGAIAAGSCAGGYILSEVTDDDTPHKALPHKNYIPPDYYKLAEVNPAPSLEKHKDVVQLINECVSMSLEEKDDWIRKLPTISEKHIAELKQALLEEKEKLAKAEQAEESE